MDTALLAFVAIVVTALVFDFTNGFHDAANAIATSIGTRALTPRVALIVAASMNLLGALISTGVAETVGSGIITTPVGNRGLAVVFAAVAGAICWNLLTWWFGLPSSSSHALIGGLVGAALAATTGVQWDGVASNVLLPMVLSPLIGFGLAFGVQTAIMWAFYRRRWARSTVGSGWRRRSPPQRWAWAMGCRMPRRSWA
jgi:PiT family inorganic phosphate transporter